ncbi:BamA/TamA family outer membrane protein [Spirulina sp. 06S082]|uniref:BamA/TamA family outer membrane protein n=1 Tax=Spirulina sp. 06S082 TaxID=3110248 RepID=UPI002B21228F|nr:BamA/TamA family outer membrane protein [Spirulina sp. 06S082]MEA5472023.1 BamA/TamA family outer membrane protein [Spirulina sp. 06S082]
MQPLSTASMLRLSIILFSSTTVNLLFAGENWGLETNNLPENAIAVQFRSDLSPTKSLESIPDLAKESFKVAKQESEGFSVETANISIAEGDRNDVVLIGELIGENTNLIAQDQLIDILYSSFLASLEAENQNNTFDSLDELSIETANLPIKERKKVEAIAIDENNEANHPELLPSPAINSITRSTGNTFPAPGEVSFKAEDLLAQESNESEDSNADNDPETANDRPEVEQEVLGGDLNIPFSSDFGLGVFIGEPTALQGQVRAKPVLRGTRTSANLPATAYFRQKFGTNNNLLLILGGDLWVIDPKSFGFDLSYFHDYESSRLSVNIANIQTEYPAFNGGTREVNLPNGNKPIFDSIGGGIEYLQVFNPEWSVAFGLNYYKVSIRDGLLSSSLEPVDELGNRLTVSDRGQDDLLSLNISALYNNVNDSQFPSEGTRIRLGLDQAIPVGDANIAFNRLSGNLTQFIPLDLFGFTKGPRTLVLNLQGGTILGQVPPYEGFTLGGGGSIRGYDVGDIGTGRSFILATAEYRFPVSSITLFQENLDLIGSIFVDYGSDLGTGNNVLGQPGEVRQKPGDGFGFGVGLLTKTSIGLFRFELSFSDNGDSAIYFNIGERF